MSGRIRTALRSPIGSRFIDGMRTLLYVAKESADACGPLKSCLGGISAIVELYDKTNDIEGSLAALTGWVVTMKEELTKEASYDNNEAERRKRLKWSLEQVEKKCRSLQGKKWLPKILDFRQDSATVVELLEELRQAILIYTVSQQQSTLDQVTNLATSFDKFVKSHEHKLPDVGKRATFILERLRDLQRDLETGPGDGKIDDKESTRRATLIESLTKTGAELSSLLDRLAAGDEAVTTDHRQLVEDLTEEIRYAIHTYKLSQQMDIYERSLTLISADQSLLNSIGHAKGAEYDHRGRSGCLQGTRVVLLHDIEEWAQDKNRPGIFWLNGLAGTGKSTIAQTVAERCDANGTLGASFFFPGASDGYYGLIFPTLAYQLAHKYTPFRSALLRHLRSSRDIGYKPLNEQAEKLIIGPLQSVGDMMVIVIDGLDECKDRESPRNILSELERIAKNFHTVKFFVTSRPEPGIKRHLSLGDTAECHVIYDTVQDPIDEDIWVFLEHKLSRLAADRGEDGWPTVVQLDLLRDRAALLFAYAVATVRFFEDSWVEPRTIYDTIEESRDDTKYEGTVEGVHKGLSLDSLCISTLKASFAGKDVSNTAMARSVLAAALSIPPSSSSAILTTVNDQANPYRSIGEVTRVLESFHSLLDLPKGPDFPVRPFHRLLSHCLTDPSRCPDERFLM